MDFFDFEDMVKNLKGRNIFFDLASAQKPVDPLDGVRSKLGKRNPVNISAEGLYKMMQVWPHPSKMLKRDPDIPTCGSMVYPIVGFGPSPRLAFIKVKGCPHSIIFTGVRVHTPDPGMNRDTRVMGPRAVKKHSI